MNKSKLLYLVLLIFSLSCTNSTNQKVVVDFAEDEATNKTGNPDKLKPVYIAIASMTSPKETHIYYNDLVEHISEKVGFPIYIKQKQTYAEVNKLLEDSEVDFAFICSGAFVEEYSNGKIKLLVAPEIDQKVSYHAYIIAQKGLDIDTFEDLENSSFAFTDPLSNTGRLFPLKKLADLGKSEEEFFKKTIYTYGHDISIQMVNRGIIDGASVHGLIYDYHATHHPEKVKNVYIVEVSESYGIPPIVTPAALSKERYDQYKEVFLSLHEDSVGRKILEKLDIDKFVIVDDSIYESVFQLKEFINNEASK